MLDGIRAFYVVKQWKEGRSDIIAANINNKTSAKKEKMRELKEIYVRGLEMFDNVISFQTWDK